MRRRLRPEVHCRLGSEEQGTARAPTRGRWVRVPLPAAPSGRDTSQLWSGPLISEAALWGLSSLLLPLSLRGRPPSDVAAVNQSAPAAPRGGGLKGTLAPRPQDPEPGASRSLSNRAAWCWSLSWKPAWFRLEGREERARGPDAPCGSHPRLDIQDRNRIAAARPAHPALHEGSCPGLGHFQITGLHQAPAAGSPPAHAPVGARSQPCTQFLRLPTFRVAGSHAPSVQHSAYRPCPAHILTHSHTYTLQPALASAIGLWVPSRRPARPYLGRVPLRTGPCSSGLSEQRALDPAGGPQNRPGRSRVGAGPELRRGGSLERHRQRGGAAPASESEPRPRLQGARLGRASWGNCSEGKDSASSSPEISGS